MQWNPGEMQSIIKREWKVELMPASVVALLCSLLALLAFRFSFTTPLLLDEQHIANWITATFHNSANTTVNDLFGFKGFAAADGLGPLGALISIFSLNGPDQTATRFIGFVLHALNAVALYFVVTELFPRSARTTESGQTAWQKLERVIASLPWPGAAAALIFSVFPLTAEATFYSGGRGIQLCSLFFLSSFFFYLRSHPVRVDGFDENRETSNRFFSFLSVALFLASVLTLDNAWFFAKIFVAYELTRFLFDRDAKEKYRSLLRDGGKQKKLFILRLALILLVAVAGFIITSVRAGVAEVPYAAAGIDDIKRCFLTLLFPINRSIYSKYAADMHLLYALLPIAAVSLTVAMFKHARARAAIIFLFMWLGLSALIFAAVAVPTSELYEARFLYFSSAALCALIGAAAFAPFLSITRLKSVTAAFGLLLFFMFFFPYLKQTSTQVNAYRGAGKMLAKIKSSARILSLKEQQPFILVRDVPRSISIQPLVSPYRVFAMDGETGLIRAPQISAGSLKDTLRKGELRAVTTRWDATAESFVPVLLAPERNHPPFDLDAAAITSRLSPPVTYWKNVTHDAKNQCLEISSNSINEPGIRLYPGELSPLDGDFMMIDAEIETPIVPRNPNIELHWVTGHLFGYEKEDRRALTPAKLDVKGYQRYLLNLRSTGWTTNGTISLLTLGFPSSAKAKLKRMTIINGEGRMPKLNASTAQAKASLSDYSNYCFNFPTDPRLGLFSVSQSQPLTIEYDASSIDSAASCLLEIRRSENLGAVDLSDFRTDKASRTLALDQVKGKISLAPDQFPSTGTFRLRAIALDKNKEPKERFSDTIECFVSKAR